MKKCITTFFFIASQAIDSPAIAKGLDKLQADTQPVPPAESAPDKSATDAIETTLPPEPAPPKVKEAEPVPSKQPVEVVNQQPSSPPPEPGLQSYYVGTGLSIFNISAKTAGWHSSIGADLEAGYKVATISKFGVFATYRYLAADVTANADQRAYRGIVETHNFGSKAHYKLRESLMAFASGELGLTQTHLTPSDGRLGTDEDLQKPGVALTLGGGVSYLVLDKIGVGARLALGTGQYNSVQLGLDLRFLF